MIIHRGNTAGNVGFFCLSQADVEEAGLDERHLSRLVRQSMYIDGYDFRDEDWEELRADGRDVWLLNPDEVPGVPASTLTFREQVKGEDDVPNDYGEDDPAELRAYLEAGVTEYGLHDVDCLDNRPHWYRPRREPSRQVLVRNASRDGFRFVLNETGARHINNLFAFADVTLDEPELKALLAFLNSSLFDLVVRDYKKTRDGGFDAISPNDLESVPVLNPTTLRGEVVTQLGELFDELRETARQGDDCEPVNDRITSIIETELELH